MPEITPTARFFDAYEKNIANRNLDAMVAQFAETYLYGGPNGFQFLRPADLAAGIPRRRELLNSLGCGPSRLASLTETALDSRFVLARVQWEFAVEKAAPVTIESTFLLDTVEPVRILVYLSHQDLVAKLKERQQIS